MVERALIPIHGVKDMEVYRDSKSEYCFECRIDDLKKLTDDLRKAGIVNYGNGKRWR